MNCPTCGQQVSSDLNYCPSCGRQFREPPFRSSGHALGPPPPHAGGTSERSTLILVIAIVLVIVVLPIVLSAVLYFMVLGFGDSGTSQTPALALVKQTPVPADGVKYQVASISRTIPWEDVTIVLSDGLDAVSWRARSSGLDGGGPVTDSVEPYPSALGALTVFFNITDIAGNGEVNSGDFFTLTTGSAITFSSTLMYTVNVLYDPNGNSMCTAYFSG